MQISRQRTVQTKRPANAKALRQKMCGVMEEPQGRPCGKKEVSKKKESWRRYSEGQIIWSFLGYSGAFRYSFK